MYSYKIWDKKSSINGVSAKEVMKIHNITTSDVGIVVDDTGTVIVLQYNNSDPLTKEALTDILEKITYEMNNPTVGEESDIEDME